MRFLYVCVQMYEEVHMMTPMVAPREFVFVRYCHQPELGTWLICDASFVPLDTTGIPAFTSPFWKLPSGCLIQQLPNGFSKVINHYLSIYNSLYSLLYCRSGLRFREFVSIHILNIWLFLYPQNFE